MVEVICTKGFSHFSASPIPSKMIVCQSKCSIDLSCTVIYLCIYYVYYVPYAQVKLASITYYLPIGEVRLLPA